MSDETNPNDLTPPEFSDRNRVTGVSAPDSHRAAEGEGVRAPLAQDGADHPEFSVFDGQGREQVVVVQPGPDGKTVQATGDSSEEAQGLVGKMKDKIGDAFGPPKGH